MTAPTAVGVEQQGGFARGKEAAPFLTVSADSITNVLEGAVALAEAESIHDKDGHVAPRLEDVEAAAQQRVLAYDRAGDGHLDTASAFIKSLRGNDPDGALYWLASMIAATRRLGPMPYEPPDTK